MRICNIPDCGRKHAGRGLCTTHFERKRQGVPLDRPVRSLIKAGVSPLERLRAYAPEGAPGDCWEWTMCRNKNYGMISVGGTKKRGAHIVAWEIANSRTLPDGMVIRHKCDNPPCTNPAHLELGEHADNVGDRVARGPSFKGEGNAMVKLTDDDVRTIRALCAKGMKQRVVAEQFGVKQANISCIVTRKTWAHI